MWKLIIISIVISASGEPSTSMETVTMADRATCVIASVEVSKMRNSYTVSGDFAAYLRIRTACIKQK